MTLPILGERRFDLARLRHILEMNGENDRRERSNESLIDAKCERSPSRM
jgi:hypothetical protein